MAILFQDSFPGESMRVLLTSTILSMGLMASACVAGDPAMSAESWELDRQQLLSDLQTLAADDMEGREVATPGNARARAYLIDRLEAMGAAPMGDSYEHPFSFTLRLGNPLISFTLCLQYDRLGLTP